MSTQTVATPLLIDFLDEETLNGMASLNELTDFCNRVREAGGAESIKDLMPAIPGDSKSCLIAKALNFSCSIRDAQGVYEKNEDAWCMAVSSNSLAEKIGKACHLPVVDDEIILPKKIYRVAQVYDAVADLLSYITEQRESDDGLSFEEYLDESKLTRRDKSVIKKFWPYLEDPSWPKPSFV